MTYQDTDASLPVPTENRSNGIDILFVWMGFILVVASMSFGGGLAANMSFPDLVLAVIVGNLFLAFLAFFTGYIGSKTGLSFSALAVNTFTGGGWRFALLYIPLNLVGWYSIQSAIFGGFFADTFNLGNIGKVVAMSGAALFFSITAYLGMRFMSRVSIVLVPVIIISCLYAIANVGDSAELTFGFSETTYSFWTGVSIVMSTWIFSVLLVVPDLTRFIRDPLRAGLIAALGVFVANTLALGIGAVAAAYTKQHDPAVILSSLGLAPLAFLLTFAGIWSTNDNNMYSSALSVSRMLSISREKVVVLLAFIGALVAAFNPAQIGIMFTYLIFMGASAPPLAGVVIGSHLYKRGKETTGSMFAPWLAWFGASAVAYQLSGVIVIPAGIVLGFAFWLILIKVLPATGRKENAV